MTFLSTRTQILRLIILTRCLKPIFHLATLFARREAKTRIRRRDWLKLSGEKNRRQHVSIVPTFLSVRANKFAKWKIGFTVLCQSLINSQWREHLKNRGHKFS